MKLLHITLLLISARQLFVDAMTGGNVIVIKDVPYQAQFQYTDKKGYVGICGATIISDRWLISAGHCVGHIGFEKYQVRIGSSTTMDKGQLINVSKIIVHGNFDNQRIYDSDISLIKTKTPIEFNEYQRSIPIAREAPKVGDLLTVSGFGDSHFEIRGFLLKKGLVPVISNELCMKAYETLITDNMFCTNSSEVDMCFGDSGSPAVLNGRLVGVASQGCEDPKPNVFTNVAKLYDWIVERTGIEFDD